MYGERACQIIIGSALDELWILVNEATGALAQNAIASPVAWTAPEDNYRNSIHVPRRRR